MKQLLALVDKYYPGCPVLLAGSHAIGKATVDSDVDLLVFTNDVHAPVITFQEIDDFKVEAIEIPMRNTLFFLERTANDSGAYLFMIAMGKILRDYNGFLAELKKWGDQRYLEGPPREGKNLRIHRTLIDISNLLTDLEGQKLAEEKMTAATRLLNDLMNLLFLINDLFPMSGKWTYRKLDPLYPGIISALFSELKASIGEQDYSGFIKIVDELLMPVGGRIDTYSTKISTDRHLKTNILQIVLPGTKLTDIAPSGIGLLQALSHAYPNLYLKDFEEGGIGIVIPGLTHKTAEVYQIMEKISENKVAKYNYEPLLRNLYGGTDYYPVANEYFRLVTKLVFEISQKFAAPLQREDVMEVCAYVIPIFCSCMEIPSSELPRFSAYLTQKWISQAIPSTNEVTSDQRKQHAIELEDSLTKEVSSCDPELMEILAAILSDHSLRFGESLYDSWANGVTQISDRLSSLLEENPPSISKFQLLSSLQQTAINRQSLLWPVYEQYLSFLFDVLDVYHKDRVFFLVCQVHPPNIQRIIQTI